MLEVISKAAGFQVCKQKQIEAKEAKSTKTRNMETLKEESNEETSSIDVVDGDDDLDPRIQVCFISPALCKLLSRKCCYKRVKMKVK